MHRHPFCLRFLLPAIAVVVLFWPCFWNNDVLGFRDSMHFYYPLWKYLDRSPIDYWLLPHFNHLDRAGVAAIAEPTTMTFYPARLLQRLPWISLERSMAFFLCFHLWFAWLATYVAMRFSFRRTRIASSIAASAYAFGGFTFFQIYNPPYLISSAWLPLAIGAMYAIAHRTTSISDRFASTNYAPRIRRWQIILIVALSAMCLAGDFELPYNLGILAIGFLSVGLFKKLSYDIRFDSTKPKLKHPLYLTPRSLLLLAGCFVASVGTTAIQWIPTYHWTHLGFSSTELASRGIADRYTFSLFDIFTELIPLGLGSYTPNHTRWISVFISSGIWVPSIHHGVVAFSSVIAISALILFRRNAWLGISICCAIWFAGGEHLGGYSVLKSIAPFYDGFRYPMKWYAIASCGLCIAAAYSIDYARHSEKLRSRCSRILAAVAFVNVTVLLLAIAIKIGGYEQQLQTLTSRIPGDPLIGGFDLSNLLNQILISSSTTTLVAATSACCMRRSSLKAFIAIELVALLQLFVLAWQSTTTLAPECLSTPRKTDAIWQLQNGSIPIYWNTQTFDASMPADNSKEFMQQARSAEEIAIFQKQHAIGKLHLLDNARGMSAQLSIEPPIYRGPPELQWLQEAVQPPRAIGSVTLEIMYNRVEIHSAGVDFPVEIRLPILQDSGWTCSDPTVELTSTREQLILLRLPPKTEHVTLTYATPGLRVGGLISSLSLILAIIYFRRIHV